MRTNVRRRRNRNDTRRFRQLTNQIGELRTEVRRLRSKISRRRFIGELGIIATVLAWVFPRSQPLPEPQPFTLDDSTIGGPDTLGGGPLLITEDGALLVTEDGALIVGEG